MISKVTTSNHDVLNVEPPKLSVTSAPKKNVEAMNVAPEHNEVLITTAPKTSLLSAPKPEQEAMKVTAKHHEVLTVDSPGSTPKPEEEPMKVTAKLHKIFNADFPGPAKETAKLEVRLEKDEVITPLLDLSQGKLTPIQTLDPVIKILLH